MCVAETDLGKMTWYDAMEYCKINKDWRLPTRKELNQTKITMNGMLVL